MRLAPALVISTLLSAPVFPQTLAPPPSTLQHITISASSTPSVVARGATATLFADITPKPNIHVYASDWQGFTPVALVITPQSAVTVGKVKYPIPEMARTVGVSEPVAVYTKLFRLAQPITVRAQAKSGETLTIAGVVNYQACDDRLCYPVASLPVTWTVKVK